MRTQQALLMLRSARQDGDAFRIHAAISHLQFLQVIARLTSSEDPKSEAQAIVGLMDFMEPDYADGDEPEPDADSLDQLSSTKTDAADGAARV